MTPFNYSPVPFLDFHKRSFRPLTRTNAGDYYEGQWSDLTNKRDGFGYCISIEAGFIYEGYWSEQKGSYQIKVNFPEKGNYLLEVSVDSNVKNLSVPIEVSLLPKRASSLPFSILGIFALITAGLVYYLVKWLDSRQIEEYS